MNEDSEFQQCSWSEGVVDIKVEHFKILYKDSRVPVALVGKGDGTNFVVQFLIPRDESNTAILNNVYDELNFYLVQLHERDHWLYAQYHSTTASNIYSNVHWIYKM